MSAYASSIWRRISLSEAAAVIRELALVKVVGKGENRVEALRLADRICVLSRRPGRIRDIIAIDIPIADRQPTMPELTTASDRIWSLIRAEAAAQAEAIGVVHELLAF